MLLIRTRLESLMTQRSIKILGPEKYDKYLTSLYGDYMIPPKDSDKNAHVSELVEVVLEEK